jgi:integrase
VARELGQGPRIHGEAGPRRRDGRAHVWRCRIGLLHAPRTSNRAWSAEARIPLYQYRRDYELHLRDYFGGTRFVDVDLRHVEAWVQRQVARGASPKSVRNRHSLLFTIIRRQGRMMLRKDNPCELTELPSEYSKDARQVRFFDQAEYALLRSCLKQDVHLLVDIALSTGMRFGEVTALRVDDITSDEEGYAQIEISRAWSRRAPNDPEPVHAAEGENASWKLGPPKIKRSRHVVVGGVDAEQVRRAVDGRGARDLVFATRDRNPWRYPDLYPDTCPERHRARERIEPMTHYESLLNRVARARGEARLRRRRRALAKRGYVGGFIATSWTTDGPITSFSRSSLPHEPEGGVEWNEDMRWEDVDEFTQRGVVQLQAENEARRTGKMPRVYQDKDGHWRIESSAPETS